MTQATKVKIVTYSHQKLPLKAAHQSILFLSSFLSLIKKPLQNCKKHLKTPKLVPLPILVVQYQKVSKAVCVMVTKRKMIQHTQAPILSTPTRHKSLALLTLTSIQSWISQSSIVVAMVVHRLRSTHTTHKVPRALPAV
jgi:hypothetical protein